MALAPQFGQNRTATSPARLKLRVATQNCARQVSHLRHFGSRPRMVFVRNMPVHPISRTRCKALRASATKPAPTLKKPEIWPSFPTSAFSRISPATV